MAAVAATRVATSSSGTSPLPPSAVPAAAIVPRSGGVVNRATECPAPAFAAPLDDERRVVLELARLGPAGAPSEGELAIAVRAALSAPPWAASARRAPAGREARASPCGLGVAVAGPPPVGTLSTYWSTDGLWDPGCCACAIVAGHAHASSTATPTVRAREPPLARCIR